MRLHGAACVKWSGGSGKILRGLPVTMSEELLSDGCKRNQKRKER